MRIGLEFSEEDLAQGFDSSVDYLGRKHFANQLTNLFNNLDQGSVCLLDGRWGIGKSTFVKQWAVELKKSGIPSIYFDAFSSDYIESPFQAVAGTFVTAVRKAEKLDEPNYKTFLNAAAKVGKTVGAVSARVGIKAATLGLVGAAELDALHGAGESLADGAGDVAEEAVKRLIESHAQSEADFKSLRTALTKLPQLLSISNEADTTTPLIVIIDELDRCRPDFALGILETLKHFFRTDRIHFIVVTNKSHLELSIAHRYGISDAAKEYLEKFYDFIIYFEQSTGKSDAKNIRLFATKISEKLLPKTSEYNDLVGYISLISEAYDLSLRQIERYVTNLCLSYIAFNERGLRPTILLAFLGVIKTMNPPLYRKAKNHNLSFAEVRDFIFSGRWDNNLFDAERVTKVFQYYLDDDINIHSGEWDGFGSATWNYNINRTDVVSFVANNVLDTFYSG